MFTPKLKERIAKMRNLIAESRSEKREPCNEELAISWRDARGRITHTQVRCLDMSNSGACFRYRDPIAMPAVVQIRASNDGTCLVAKVRRCTPKETGYEIGIEFCRDAPAVAD